MTILSLVPRTPGQRSVLTRYRRASAARGAPLAGRSDPVGGAGRWEAGQASIQTAILLPVVILAIIVFVQATLWFAGRQVAIAAASEGARIAAAEGSTAQAGQTAAVQFAGSTGRGFLLVPGAIVTRTETTATVTVTGTTQSLVGGTGLSITQTASMPVERLTAPDSAGPP